MSHAELARIIDDAFDKRDGVSPATTGPVRDAVETALDLLDRGEARVAEKQADKSLARQPMAEEGGAAVVPPQRHDRDPRRPGQSGVVGQGRRQVRRLGRGALPRCGLPRGARLRSCGAPPTSRRAWC